MSVAPPTESQECVAERLYARDSVQDFIRVMSSPWAWPRDGHVRDALRAMGAASPPRLAPGQTAFLTVDQAGPVRLWHVSATHIDHNTGSFEGPYLNRWPTLKKLVDELYQGDDSTNIFPHWINSSDPANTPPVFSVEDDSCDLAVCCHYASLRLKRAPREDLFIASAIVDEEGNLRPVGGLTEKIGALPNLAPSVRYFVVAKGEHGTNEVKAKQVAIDCQLVPALEIKAFDRLDEALRWMLGFTNEEVAASGPSEQKMPAATTAGSAANPMEGATEGTWPRRPASRFRSAPFAGLFFLLLLVVTLLIGWRKAPSQADREPSLAAPSSAGGTTTWVSSVPPTVSAEPAGSPNRKGADAPASSPSAPSDPPKPPPVVPSTRTASTSTASPSSSSSAAVPASANPPHWWQKGSSN